MEGWVFPPGPRPHPLVRPQPSSSHRFREGTETRPSSFLLAGRCSTSLSRFDSNKHSLPSNCPDLASRQSRCIAAPPASTPSDTQNLRPLTALTITPLQSRIALIYRCRVLRPVADEHQTGAPPLECLTSNLTCRRALSPNNRRRRTLTGRSDGSPRRRPPFRSNTLPYLGAHHQHCFRRQPPWTTHYEHSRTSQAKHRLVRTAGPNHVHSFKSTESRTSSIDFITRYHLTFTDLG